MVSTGWHWPAGAPFSSQPCLLDYHLQAYSLATDESSPPCPISHLFSSPTTTPLQERLCLLNWSISCLRRLPLLHTSHLANIHVCQFNCVPISSPKLFTYSLTHAAKLPFPHVADPTGMAMCYLDHNLTFNWKLVLKSRPTWSLKYHSTSYTADNFDLSTAVCCTIFESLCSYISAWNWHRVQSESWMWTDMEPKPNNIPKRKLQEQSILRGTWFHVSGWLFTMVFPPITIQPWVCWLEVLFQWVHRAWNQTGITLLSHSGFTWFIYNSLLIVLDHQLILCSQEGVCCTLSTQMCATDAYCPPVVVEHITIWWGKIGASWTIFVDAVNMAGSIFFLFARYNCTQ